MKNTMKMTRVHGELSVVIRMIQRSSISLGFESMNILWLFSNSEDYTGSCQIKRKGQALMVHEILFHWKLKLYDPESVKSG